MLYFVEISLDGVGVSGSINSTHSYPKDCRNARDMFVGNGSLLVANDCGILKMDLNSDRSRVSRFQQDTLVYRSAWYSAILQTWGPNRLRLHNRMVTSRLLPEPEKQAIVMVHVRRFTSQWVCVWKTTKPFLSPMLNKEHLS